MSLPPPSYSSSVGYIGENTFTIYMDESLDAGHPPSLSSFIIQVNGTGVTATNVVVNSGDASVTLTLPSLLLPGDVIDFAYTDPTSPSGGGIPGGPESDPADGDDVYAIQATDGTDASSFNKSTTVSISRPGPAAPAMPTLDSGSDTGILNNDGITKVTTPTITGTAAANATVKLYDTDNTLLGTTTADGGGNWSIVSSSLGDGAHTLTVTQTDASNVTSPASTGLVLTIDSTPPGSPMLALDPASDNGLLNNDGVTNVTTPVITGTTDANATVRLYDTDGTTLLGSTTADGLGHWSITSSTLTPGSHTVTVKATDLAGNVGLASSGLSLTIDTTPPAPLDAPSLEPLSDSALLDNVTNVATPTITGTATPGSVVTLYDTNGTDVLGSTVVDGTGIYAITSTLLADAVHSLSVKVTDLAGNVSAASPNLDVTIDTTPPPAPITPPFLETIADSGVPGDGVTNVTAPTFTGFALPGSVVTLYDTDGTTVLGSATASNIGIYEIVSSTLTEGPHSLTVKTSDEAGNVSSASPALALTIDTTPPATPSIAPELTALSDSGTLGDDVTNATTPIITGSAAPNSLVTLYDTDGTVLGTATSNGQGVYGINASTLAEGSHSLTVKVSDSAGNLSLASPALNLDIDTTPPPAPTTVPVLADASDSGLHGDGLTNVLTPTITGTASPGSVVTLYDTDGVTARGTAVADVSGAYSIVSASLTPGFHALTVKAADPAGNASAASPALEITVDTTPPPAPDAPILPLPSDSGLPGDGLTNVTAPTLIGITTPGNLVTLYDTDGTTVLGTATANDLGVYAVQSSTLGQGSHSLSVKVTNAIGNTSAASAPLNMTVDTTVPEAPSTAPILALPSDSGVPGDGITNVTTPTITGNALPGSAVSLYDTDGTTVLGHAVANELGNYSIISSLLGQGSHALTVRVSNIVGNVSAASPALNVTIYPAPGTPSTAPVLSQASDSGTIGDGITNSTTPTLTGTAVPGSTVTIYDGLSVLGAAAVAPDGTWSFTAGGLADGLYQLTASVADPAGNQAPLSLPLALTVDTAPPRMTAALANDTGSSPTDRITADGTLTGTGDPNAMVTVSEGDTVIGITASDAQGNWTFKPVGLSVGVHNLAASQTDAAGNTGTAQIGFRLDPQSADAPADVMSANGNSVMLARFFDTAAGTQFYVSSQSEYNNVIANRPDLKLEANSLNALNPDTVATDPDAVPVYRFFDTAHGTHFFTASSTERDSVIADRPDLHFEGVGFFEHTAPQAGDTAVYRFFDTTNGTHFYTTNEAERASLLANRPDLTNEGIGFYAPKGT